jgi:hypothetical protein
MAQRLSNPDWVSEGRRTYGKTGGTQATSLQSDLKRCSQCKEFLPLDLFPLNKRGVAGRNSWCKSCFATYHKDRKLEQKFNISRSTFEKLVENQQGLCAICHQDSDNLCVDHDHATGAVRGLLCISCNFALGFFRDDVAVLQQAISYLSSQEA